MNRPGFTAEASLFRTDMQYRADEIPTAPTDNPRVIPQFGPRILDCARGTLVHPNGTSNEVNCCWGIGISFCHFVN